MTFSDYIDYLRGKRIAMGRIPQAIWGYEPDALLRCGYSDDFYKSLSIQYVGTGEAATALVNGQVDDFICRHVLMIGRRLPQHR